ncbi:hypothetical protein Cgig2_031800 [Carnegiea gigantea]|uniref:MYB-CC type transcription factor LHEQLE-containing domain-containing protein n=1 Tax=Carnegiea gigantea TaxID=171969 RepID=A0A9Q1KP06_9CARY|nr:hypothetical protein Cgig2_031800 [Carnegiea gigantea]
MPSSDTGMYHNHSQGNMYPSPKMPAHQERQLFLQGGNGPRDSSLVLSTDVKPRLKWTPDLHERNLQINEALQMQIEVQRRLHEQLEGHDPVYFQIKQNGLSSKAETTSAALNLQRHHPQSSTETSTITDRGSRKVPSGSLGESPGDTWKANIGKVGLEAAKLQLSELVSKVSNQCLNLAFTEMTEEQQAMCLKQPNQHNKPAADCSIDSCLTSCDMPQQREQEMHNSELGLRPFNETRFLGRNNFDGNLKEHSAMLFPTTQSDRDKMMFPVEGGCSDLSMGVGIGGERQDEVQKNICCRADSFQLDNKKYKLPSFGTDLDLNARDDADAPSSIRHLDLNGLSWT